MFSWEEKGINRIYIFTTLPTRVCGGSSLVQYCQSRESLDAFSAHLSTCLSCFADPIPTAALSSHLKVQADIAPYCTALRKSCWRECEAFHFGAAATTQNGARYVLDSKQGSRGIAHTVNRNFSSQKVRCRLIRVRRTTKVYAAADGKWPDIRLSWTQRGQRS